jgi:hypothetical protein
MPKTAIHIISIHDADDDFLGFDLPDVLQALADRTAEWSWYVTEFDAIGGGGCKQLCAAVQTAAGSGVWLSSAEMVRMAADIRQTIDATLFAFPRNTAPAAVDLRTVVESFPESMAELGIRAIDSTLFEVYAKEPEVVALLKQRFRDVRDEDPRLYFGEP